MIAYSRVPVLSGPPRQMLASRKIQRHRPKNLQHNAGNRGRTSQIANAECMPTPYPRQRRQHRIPESAKSKRRRCADCWQNQAQQRIRKEPAFLALMRAHTESHASPATRLPVRMRQHPVAQNDVQSDSRHYQQKDNRAAGKDQAQQHHEIRRPAVRHVMKYPPEPHDKWNCNQPHQKQKANSYDNVQPESGSLLFIDPSWPNLPGVVYEAMEKSKSQPRNHNRSLLRSQTSRSNIATPSAIHRAECR